MSMTDESDGFLIGLDRRAAGGGGARPRESQLCLQV